MTDTPQASFKAPGELARYTVVVEEFEINRYRTRVNGTKVGVGDALEIVRCLRGAADQLLASIVEQLGPKQAIDMLYTEFQPIDPAEEAPRG